MAPPVSRYPPQNLSNPFAHLNQQPLHQASHLQHQNPSLQAHNLGGHHGFSAAGQNSLSLFGPQSTNGNIPGGFGGAGGSLGAGGAANGLASQAAQMGFAHGGNLQLQQAQEAASVASRGANQRIREVWKNNLHQEMATIRHLVDRYPYISMDTEFPGIVARPIADDFGSKAAYHYQTLRCNVDLLKIIQLGITLFTIDGEVPTATELQTASRNGLGNNLVPCPCTWTFNFRFSLEEEMWNEDSIALLKKAGTDFDKHAAMGIDIQEFGSLLITSGLTFSDDVYWISFHSGYDFGYLTKLMWCRPLPNDEEKYRKLVKKFFPNLYDVKFMLRHAQKLRDRGTVTGQVATVLQSIGQKSSLQDIAEELGCTRVGIQHTAGSDAWLTGNVFWEMRKRVFDNQVPEELNGQMWGLTGVGPPASAAAHAAVLAAQNHAAAAANGMISNSQYQTRDAGPSTPTTHPAGLASTPSQGYQSSNMTPGGGGVFGNFQYGK